MPSFQTAGSILVWLGMFGVAYVGLVESMGGANPAGSGRADLLAALSLLPIGLASHVWRPMGVVFLAVVLSFPVVAQIMGSGPGIPEWPTMVALFVFDGLAVRYAIRRQEATRRTEDLNMIGEIARLIGSGAELSLIADRLNQCGQSLVGSGRVRLWSVPLEREEINLIATGEAAVIARLPGQSRYTGVRLNYPLDATIVSARSAAGDRIVEVSDLLEAGPDLELARQEAEHDGFRSILALPLRWGGRVLGVVSFEPARRGPHHFSKDEWANLRTLAALGTIALGAESARIETPGIE
jgi:hypothetical protein